MSLSQALLPEFQMEYANTRKMLECVPDDKLDWNPYEKSFLMADLETHIAELACWATMTI